jgi:hypothetical protein
MKQQKTCIFHRFLQRIKISIIVFLKDDRVFLVLNSLLLPVQTELSQCHFTAFEHMEQ